MTRGTVTMTAKQRRELGRRLEQLEQENLLLTSYSRVSKRRSVRVQQSQAKVRGLLKRLTDGGVR